MFFRAITFAVARGSCSNLRPSGRGFKLLPRDTANGDCTYHVVKTKALISCAVTVQLICAFVFTYAKSRFSYDTAQLISSLLIPLKKSF